MQFIIDAGHGRSGGVGRRAVHVALPGIDHRRGIRSDRARPDDGRSPLAARMVGNKLVSWLSLVLDPSDKRGQHVEGRGGWAAPAMIHPGDHIEGQEVRDLIGPMYLRRAV